MKFKMDHINFNVAQLERSMRFYEKAFGLKETGKRIHPADDSFEIAFMGDDMVPVRLEMTCLRDKDGAYDLGDNETHLAFRVDDYEAAHSLHSEMGCICFENEAMGIYFVEDPDGYWIEVVPSR